jgi:hypothetical protein
MADLNPRQQIQEKFAHRTRPALPPVPKIPQAVRDANPRLSEAWDEYDKKMEDFFKQLRTSGSI